MEKQLWWSYNGIFCMTVFLQSKFTVLNVHINVYIKVSNVLLSDLQDPNSWVVYWSDSGFTMHGGWIQPVSQTVLFYVLPIVHIVKMNSFTPIRTVQQDSMCNFTISAIYGERKKTSRTVGQFIAVTLIQTVIPVVMLVWHLSNVFLCLLTLCCH